MVPLFKINNLLLHSRVHVSTVHCHCWAKDHPRITFPSLQAQSWDAIKVRLLSCLSVLSAAWRDAGLVCLIFELPEVLIAFFILIVKRIMSRPSPSAKNNTVFVCSSLCWLHLVQNSPVACPYWHANVFASQATGSTLKPQKVLLKSLQGLLNLKCVLSLILSPPLSLSVCLSPMYVCLSVSVCLSFCQSLSVCLFLPFSLTVFRLHIQTSDCIFIWGRPCTTDLSPSTSLGLRL